MGMIFSLPQDAQRDVAHPELALRTSFLDLLLSEARDIPELWPAKDKSVQVGCEAALANCPSRCGNCKSLASKDRCEDEKSLPFLFLLFL
jgi:hypothetical protein